MKPAKTVFKRCSLSLDLRTIQRAKELAEAKCQSVSSIVRSLVTDAYAKEALPVAPKAD
jgi:hypothetical protein